MLAFVWNLLARMVTVLDPAVDGKSWRAGNPPFEDDVPSVCELPACLDAAAGSLAS